MMVLASQTTSPTSGRLTDAKVLYVGELLPGSTSLQRREAIERHVLSVQSIVTRVHQTKSPLSSRLIGAAYRSGFDIALPDLLGVNAQLVRLADALEPDLIWLDKALVVSDSALETIRTRHPATRIAGYSPDDMGQRHNRSAAFDQHLPLYDLYFTTKSYCVDELQALGCRRAVFVGNAYDPAVHHPPVLSPGDRAKFGAPVTFIGTYELERARSIAALARAGIDVRVWGAGWEGQAIPGVRVEARAVYGEDYAKVISASDINLGFLRKLNRDQQTTRSIEIPACGGFMLAERTAEHLDLFEEGVEAEFFDDDQELVAKCNQYLADGGLRARVAAAGRDRCLRSGYSNDDRIGFMLSMALSAGQGE